MSPLSRMPIDECRCCRRVTKLPFYKYHTDSHVSPCSKYEWVLKSVRNTLKKKMEHSVLTYLPRKAPSVRKGDSLLFRKTPA